MGRRPSIPSEAGCSIVFCFCTGLRGDSQVSLLSFSHRFSFQANGVGVMDESVKNGIGECGVADGLVPVFDRELGGDEG